MKDMKDKIKELKEKIAIARQYPTLKHTILNQEVLDLIAKIESLDEENKRLVEVVDDWMSRYIKLEKKIKELQAVREAAEKVDWEGIILLVDGYPVEVVKLRELQRALAAKDKDA